MKSEAKLSPERLTHLERLEAESIHIMREVVAEAEKPVMLYSVGKDSAVMLHLAKMAFHPSPPPFPLMHVDTTWKFKAMYELRDRSAKEAGMELIVHQNQEAKDKGRDSWWLAYVMDSNEEEKAKGKTVEVGRA